MGRFAEKPTDKDAVALGVTCVGCCCCRFIFGLPLWQSNAVTLSRQIINATQKHFGKTVLGYELGNEVSARVVHA